MVWLWKQIAQTIAFCFCIRLTKQICNFLYLFITDCNLCCCFNKLIIVRWNTLIGRAFELSIRLDGKKGYSHISLLNSYLLHFTKKKIKTTDVGNHFTGIYVLYINIYILLKELISLKCKNINDPLFILGYRLLFDVRVYKCYHFKPIKNKQANF